MKKVLILTAALVCVLGTAPAGAADFSVFGSWLDTEDLEESVGGGVKAAFGDRFQLELRATYFPDLTEDFESFVEDPGDDPGPFTNDVEAIPLDVGVKWNFGTAQPFNPYVGGGASYYFLDAERGEIDDEAGFYVVGGIELTRATGGMGFFAEAIYREIEATVDHEPGDFENIDDIDFEELDERDLDVGGIGVNAGLIWRW